MCPPGSSRQKYLQVTFEPLVAEDAEHIFRTVLMHRVMTKSEDTAYTPDCWKSMIQTVLQTLEMASGVGPTEPGLNLDSLRRTIGQGLSHGLTSVLIDELLVDGRVTFDGQYVRLPGQVRSLSSEDAVMRKRVIEALKQSASSSPAMGPLADQLTVDPALSKINRDQHFSDRFISRPCVATDL